MESKICLDTDFLIDFLRNKKYAVEFVKNKEDKTELGTTTINLFELYCGAFNSKKIEKIQLIDSLAERLTLLNLTKKTSKKAGEIYSILSKKGELIEFRDILIASITITNNYSLKTNNLKHFKKINGLVLEK